MRRVVPCRAPRLAYILLSFILIVAPAGAAATSAPSLSPESEVERLQRQLRESLTELNKTQSNFTDVADDYLQKLRDLQEKLAEIQAFSTVRLDSVDTSRSQPAIAIGTIGGIAARASMASGSLVAGSSAAGAGNARTAGRVTAVMSLLKCPSRKPKYVNPLTSPTQLPIGSSNDSMLLGCVVGNWAIVAVPSGASALFVRLQRQRAARAAAAVAGMLMAVVTAGTAECSTALIVKGDDIGGGIVGVLSGVGLLAAAAVVLGVGRRSTRWAEPYSMYDSTRPHGCRARLAAPRYGWRPAPGFENLAERISFWFEGYRPQTASEHGVAMVLTLGTGAAVGWAQQDIECSVALGMTAAATLVQLIYTLVRNPYVRPVDTLCQGVSLTLEGVALMALVVAVATVSTSAVTIANIFVEISLILGMAKMLIDALLLLHAIWSPRCMKLCGCPVKPARPATPEEQPQEQKTVPALEEAAQSEPSSPSGASAASDESRGSLDEVDQMEQEMAARSGDLQAERKQRYEVDGRVRELQEGLLRAAEDGSGSEQEAVRMRRELSDESEERRRIDARIRELEQRIRELEELIEQKMMRCIAALEARLRELQRRAMEAGDYSGSEQLAESMALLSPAVSSVLGHKEGDVSYFDLDSPRSPQRAGGGALPVRGRRAAGLSLISSPSVQGDSIALLSPAASDTSGLLELELGSFGDSPQSPPRAAQPGAASPAAARRAAGLSLVSAPDDLARTWGPAGLPQRSRRSSQPNSARASSRQGPVPAARGRGGQRPAALSAVGRAPAQAPGARSATLGSSVGGRGARSDAQRRERSTADVVAV